MPSENRATLLVASLIIGAAIVVGAYLIRSSIDQASERIAGLEKSLAEVADARPGGPPQNARRGRPDPNRRYSVDTQGSPSMGAKNAKLTIAEFSDFQCPFCNRVNPTLDKVLEEYGDKVRVVFKHLPLSIHPKAPAAHAAAEAAHRQGKFWEMHDLIFADQRGLSDARYREYAKQIGLDLERFERDLKDPSLKKRIDNDIAEASKLGVSGTPGFFINGRFLSGAQPFPAFQALIEEELGKG